MEIVNLLKSKTAVVTGGSRGIGRSIVLTMASQGANVTFLYRCNEAAAEETLEAASELSGDNILGLMTNSELSDVLETNVIGVFNILRPVIPYMVSQRRGRIINISSVAGEKGGRGQTNYAASKGAINALTKSLAVELAPKNILVNCVAPGMIETDMTESIRQQAGDVVKSKILLGRFGQPEDVAKAVLFFASSLSDYVTGQVLHVDGGFKMN